MSMTRQAMFHCLIFLTGILTTACMIEEDAEVDAVFVETNMFHMDCLYNTGCCDSGSGEGRISVLLMSEGIQVSSVSSQERILLTDGHYDFHSVRDAIVETQKLDYDPIFEFQVEIAATANTRYEDIRTLLKIIQAIPEIRVVYTKPSKLLPGRRRRQINVKTVLWSVRHGSVGIKPVFRSAELS